MMSLAAMTAALVGIEIILRFLPETRVPKANKDRPKLFYMAHGSTSARGEVWPPPEDQKGPRIAIVGDSFTFAPKMQPDTAFPAILNRLLNLKGVQPPPHVYNLGTPGFATHHEIQVVKQAVDAGVDLVILEITLNDGQSHVLRHKPGQFVLPDKESIWGKIFYASRLVQFVATRIHNTRSVRQYIDYHYDLFNTPESWQRFQESIMQMKALCDAKQVRFTTMIFPLFDFKIDDSYPFHELHRKIAHFLRSRGIPTLDLQDYYRGIEPARLQLIPGADSHPNEIGHRIAAEALYEWLSAQDILPREIFQIRTYKNREGVRERGAVRAIKLQPRKAQRRAPGEQNRKKNAAATRR